MVQWAVLLLILLQQTSACEDLACFADYIQTLECMWQNGFRPAQRAHYNLTATWDCGEGGTCFFNLTSSNATHGRYSCFSEQKLCFGNNVFVVNITKLKDGPAHHFKGCSKNFLFQNHIKPYPPFNLIAVTSRFGYNISWETRYQEQEYNSLDGNLQYELRYMKKGLPWQGRGQTLPLQEAQRVLLQPQQLEENTDFEFEVRSRPGKHSSYQGTWSDWSTPSALKTLYKDGGDQRPEMFLLLFTLLAALVALLGCHQRMRKKLQCFTPSPAPFFQSLYLNHNGDFKKWVGSPCSGTTLDVFEWGTVVPEIFGIGHQHLVWSCAKGEWGQGHTAQPSGLQASAEDCGANWGQVYGRLSIGTVTVAEEFASGCPSCSSTSPHCALKELPEETDPSERDSYRAIQLEDSDSHAQVPAGYLHLGNEMPQEGPLLPGRASWAHDPLAFLPLGYSLSRKSGDSEEFFGLSPATCCLSPAEEDLFCRTLLSPDWDGDGDPTNSLDLDTFDSGFADCECRSSGESELAETQTGCGCQSEPSTVEEEPKREIFLPRYVKQWISCHNN